MLRGLDGFARVNGQQQAMLKYTAASVAAGFVIITNDAPDDPNGWCLQCTNSIGSGNTFVREFDLQSTWNVGIHFKLPSAPGADRNLLEFASAIDGQSCALVVRTDRTLRVTRLSDNTVLGTTSYQVPFNDWTHIEIQVVPGPSASFRLRTTAAGSTTPITRLVDSGFSLPRIDRVTLRMAILCRVTNYYIGDGQGSGAQTGLLGPARVTTLFPISDAGAILWTPSSGAPLYPMLTENRPSSLLPDGDLTYISNPALASQQFFYIAESPCFGLVYGVAINACAYTTAASQVLDFRAKQGGVSNLVGTVDVTGTTLGAPLQDPHLFHFGTIQALTQASYLSGRPWNDAEINATQWGIGNRAGASLRVTQFYIEKLTSMDPTIPFNCGQTAYAF